MKVSEVFSEGKKVLCIYFTAGYPNLEDTAKIILSLQDRGVDLIEVGMPYSDPMVDGAVIQESSRQALQKGMTLDVLFDQLYQIRFLIRVPIVLMGYYNQMFRYGIDRFLRRAKESGCSGILFPDLPLEEYVGLVKEGCDVLELSNIQLITDRTSSHRLRSILSLAQGFLYVVSGSVTTGSEVVLGHQTEYFQKLQFEMPKFPRMLGFGIDSREKLKFSHRYFDGAVIGSAFIKALDGNDLERSMDVFFERISIS